MNGQTKPVEQEEMEQSGSSGQNAQAFAVCDGMGGETSGEMAAEMAVETLKEYAPEHLFQRWRDYVADANERICRYQERCGATVGTTLSAVVLDGNRACAFNVGDSRIYLLRGGQLQQLSYDHTEFQVMVEAGVLKKEDFSRSKAHNRLTQHLGISSQEMELEPNIVILDMLKEGDKFLLCSDGLYGVVPDEILQDSLLHSESPERTCDELIGLALNQGSRDNITAMVIAVHSEEAREPVNRTASWRLPVIPIVGGLLAILLALALGAGWYYPKVPNLIMLEESEAVSQLENLGLRAKGESAYSDSIKKGTVIAQSIPEGRRALRGSQLLLTISMGRERVYLPDTTGQLADIAVEQLRAEGFVVDTAREYSDAAEGTVLSQTPAGGRKALAGSKVKLTVSRGVQTNQAEVSEAQSESEQKQAEKSENQAEVSESTTMAEPSKAASASNQTQSGEPEEPSKVAAENAEASTKTKKSKKAKKSKKDSKKQKKAKKKKKVKKQSKAKKNSIKKKGVKAKQGVKV